MWVSAVEVELDKDNPLRRGKGPFQVEKVWKLARPIFMKDGSVKTELSMSCYTSRESAERYLGD